ncbi:MAG TPA: hypothetical protein VFA91_09505 [Candidatus Polarisedimenticolia bacterium]|jgi:hypothetical protein|nr:hypothetical protein [Candidatus Polarisedimenticolia bacterium]
MKARLPRAIGYALLATGLVVVILSAATAGVFMGASGGEDTQSYDATRLFILLGLSWLAVAWAMWRAGQIKLLVSVIGLAAIGFGMGALALGDTDAGGSADSKSDVGFVVGSAGMLIGLFVSWGGARLLWPWVARQD